MTTTKRRGVDYVIRDYVINFTQALAPGQRTPQPGPTGHWQRVFGLDALNSFGYQGDDMLHCWTASELW